MPSKRCKRRAFWQATLPIAPSVKRHRVVRGEERNRMNSFKNNWMLPQRVIERGGRRRDPNVCSLKPAQELSFGGHIDRIRFRCELHPNPCIRAVVDKVIDEAHVPLKRD